MFKKLKKEKTQVEPASDQDLMSRWIESTEEESEGHLSLDVYEAGDNIIVKSTIAGARPQDLDVSVNGDVLTIKGERHLSEDVDYNDYLYRECYWGKFSRTVILPAEIDEPKVDASLENGVLTVILPKLKKNKNIKINVEE
jgi:HSP20 family protein